RVIVGKGDARTLRGPALLDLLLLLPVMDRPEQGKRGVRNMFQATLYEPVLAVPGLAARQDALAFFRHDVDAIPYSNLAEDLRTPRRAQHVEVPAGAMRGFHHRPSG